MVFAAHLWVAGFWNLAGAVADTPTRSAIGSDRSRFAGGLNWRGEWSTSARGYFGDDLARHSGSIWIGFQRKGNSEPSDGHPDWKLVSESCDRGWEGPLQPSSGDDTFVLKGGNAVFSSGSVGIGTINPDARLEVSTPDGVAVLGRSTRFEAVRGESDASSAAAVAGFNSSTGPGLIGRSRGGHGVLGVSEENDGVTGRSNANNKSGVFGVSDRPGGWGVFGASKEWEGVHGESQSNSSAAVAGVNQASGPGVYGESKSGGYGGVFRGKVRVGALEITGGADLAEPFSIDDDLMEPGSVLVIDDANPGKLKRSTQEYDTRVAGVLSGANGVQPGISLRQEGVLDSGKHVALAGRVFVRAEAVSTPIRPGDLLTTSETAGHAMKARDPARAQGAILGKAMSGLAGGRGLVLVLVTLQ